MYISLKGVFARRSDVYTHIAVLDELNHMQNFRAGRSCLAHHFNIWRNFDICDPVLFLVIGAIFLHQLHSMHYTLKNKNNKLV